MSCTKIVWQLSLAVCALGSIRNLYFTVRLLTENLLSFTIKNELQYTKRLKWFDGNVFYKRFAFEATKLDLANQKAWYSLLN